MKHLLLLTLCALLTGPTASQAVTKCTDRACFTLHRDKLRFDQANNLCMYNGGGLITIRNVAELEDVKYVLSVSGYSVNEKVWIGLSVSKGNCVVSGEKLHGFKWTSSRPEDSEFSNWSKEPRNTCTEERCVFIHADEDLKWHDGSCKDSAFYVCKFQFKGMCKPLWLAGAGKIEYTVPFSNVSLKQGTVLTMLPHGTFAEVSCAGTDERQNSLCRETDALFVWYKPGPFCASEKRSCGNQNGGCDHLCFEGDEIGVHCGCREGYYLGDDKVNCFAKDNCHNSACEHKCVSIPTGYTCVCPKGFQLAENQYSCIDVDECLTNVCGDHFCRNTKGGYECECKTGFRKVEGKCEDTDECAESRCGSNAKCLNSQGSFSCYCATGFIELNNTKECIDIDECVNSPCEHTCSNTFGSYTCSCRTDFRLAENEINCVPDTKLSIQILTSKETDEPLSQEFDRSSTTTLGPFIFNETTTDPSVRKDTFFGMPQYLVYVLGSVVPLFLLIALSSIIAIHRWNRSRKNAKKKNATADSYCWVSSGIPSQLETEQN